MPIYEYRCKDCQHETEILKKISESGVTQCPACKHDTLERIISAPRFRLGGGGWYETDEKAKSQQRNVIRQDGKSESSSSSLKTVSE